MKNKICVFLLSFIMIFGITKDINAQKYENISLGSNVYMENYDEIHGYNYNFDILNKKSIQFIYQVTCSDFTVAISKDNGQDIVSLESITGATTSSQKN